MSEFTLIRKYLDSSQSPDNKVDYFNQFLSSNVIVNACSSNISFTKKKCGLSVKCAFNGSEIYETDWGKYRVDDRCYLILNREQPYSGYINSVNAVESFSLFFEKDMVDDVIGYLYSRNPEAIIEYGIHSNLQPVTFYEKTYLHDNILSPSLFRLKNYISSGGTDEMYIEENFHLILSLMYKVHKKVVSEVKNLPYTNKTTKIDLFKKLNRAKDYIDCFFYKNLNLKKVSGEAYLSPHHFLRLFSKVFHMTPHQYITFKRLEESKRLLGETNYSITEIGNIVGYTNLSTFSRLFKKHYFISPEIYRNSNTLKKSISVK